MTTRPPYPPHRLTITRHHLVLLIGIAMTIVGWIGIPLLFSRFHDSLALRIIAGAVQWSGVVVIIVSSRQLLRRPGECPLCGYDLRGCRKRGCPECGWGREET